MQLHRADGNDWDTLAPQKWNVWQRLADRTNGLLTPGNVVTLIGAAIVTIGLVVLASNGSVWLGAGLILLGRAADLLDGFLADRSGTKSAVGEAMDASVDKLELAAALVVLWQINLLPTAVFIILAVQAIYNVVISVTAKLRGRRLPPSHSGKLGALVEWLTIGLFIAHYGAHLSANLDHIVSVAAWLGFSLFVAFALISGAAYTSKVFGSHEA